MDNPILLTREEVFESLAQHALQACVECGVTDKSEIDKIASLGATVYGIDPRYVIDKLHKMETYIHYEQAIQKRGRGSTQEGS